MTIYDEYKGDRKHNTTNTIDSSIRQALTLKKPIGSRVDYNLFNYCSDCNLKYSKQILRCPDCRQKVRTKPWHPSKVMRLKEFEKFTDLKKSIINALPSMVKFSYYP
jgi:hypothetical protein